MFYTYFLYLCNEKTIIKDKMKGIYASVFIALGVLVLSSCEEKKKTQDIIAPKPVVKAPSGPVKMQGYNHSEKVEWGGRAFTVSINRVVDDSAPVFSDESNNKYYENKITLVVKSSDGSEFFRREFTKQSFSQIIDNTYLSKSTILGLAVDHVDAHSVVFVASVGCPDQLSDDFIPINLTLSDSGSLSMKKGDDIGTSDNPNADDDEEGV